MSTAGKELEWKNVAIIIATAIEADKPPMEEDGGWRVGVGLPSNLQRGDSRVSMCTTKVCIRNEGIGEYIV